jgi:hypothetical protein
MLQNRLPLQACADSQIRPLEPTLADVLAAIEHDGSLPKPTRDGMCCSIRRVAKFLEREPA